MGPHGCSPKACSILLLVLCVPKQVELKSPFGKMEFAGKCRVIVLLRVSGRQSRLSGRFPGRGESAECASLGMARVPLG